MQNHRSIWVSIILLTAVLVGAVGGLLSWFGGMNPANAVLAGAGVFSGTAVLILVLAQFLRSKGT